MAVPPYPDEFKIGGGDHVETMVVRPRELLVGFTGLTADDIDARLAIHEVQPPADVDPRILRSLRLRSKRWVVVPELSSNRQIAQLLLNDPDCWLASPVYLPGSAPIPDDASAPLPGTLIVELTTPGDGVAIGELIGRGLHYDAPEVADELSSRFAYFTVPSAGSPDRGFDHVDEMLRAPVAGVASVQFDWLKIDPIETTRALGSLWPKQWNLTKIGMPAAWKLSTGRADVSIAVVDLGIDLEHPGLKGAFTKRATHASFAPANGGQNAFTQTGNAQVDMTPTPISDPATEFTTDDTRWHGTAVAGIIASSSVVAGMAPGCKILPIRLDEVTFITMKEALKWARSQGAKVVNYSISASGPDLGLQLEFEDAAETMVICAASGNADSAHAGFSVVYPAAYASVIAVGAATQNDDPKTIGDGPEDWYSRGGANLDVLAPGIGIPTVDAKGKSGYNQGGAGRLVRWFGVVYGGNEAGPSSGNQQTVFTGTSAAAAHASALAGLLYSKFPTRTSERVREVLERSCFKSPTTNFPAGGNNGSRSTSHGYGRIAAGEALKRAK